MIEPLKDKFYGMDYPPLATKKKPDLEDVVEKVNELVDAVNKLTKEEEYKEGRYTLPGYIPKTASEDQDRYDEELLATYKARLRERIKNDLEGDRSLVRAEVYKRVLDLIEKE